MSIACKICGQEFDRMVSYQHLRKDHNMSTSEYKEKFGDIISEETKSLHALRIPHNKGKKLSGEALTKIQEAIRNREEKYNTGELTRKSQIFTEERREKIAKGVIEYAKNNHEELSNRAKKATNTKKSNGHDLGFFRGKKHTPETREKMKMALARANINKTIKSSNTIIQNSKLCNVTILNDPTSKLLELKCNVCDNTFTFTRQYLTNSKMKSTICCSCYPRTYTRSQAEKELYDYVKSLCDDIIANDRSVLSKAELDIYVPSKNIAIEYNGLYWHSEQVLETNGHDKNKDNIKRKLCNNLGIRYIAVMEDEWENKKSLVKSRLANILGKTNKKIFARQCEVREISPTQASLFCEKYHMQGKGRSNIRLGLFHHDELVSVMTFSNSNISRKITEWELNRFCSVSGYIIVGGASKLFKKFINLVNPETIITYADLRWSEGYLYSTLGFEFAKETVPNYWYIKGNLIGRIHRYKLRKNSSDDQTKTEKQLRTEQGYLRIWDCGSSKWIWKRAE